MSLTGVRVRICLPTGVHLGFCREPDIPATAAIHELMVAHRKHQDESCVTGLSHTARCNPSIAEEVQHHRLSCFHRPLQHLANRARHDSHQALDRSKGFGACRREHVGALKWMRAEHTRWTQRSGVPTDPASPPIRQTAVWVSHLPLEATSIQLAHVFSPAGSIAKNKDGIPRIRLRMTSLATLLAMPSLCTRGRKASSWQSCC
jgi:hypothetical protein